MFGPDEINLMKEVCLAVDPAKVANPGKVFPTPRTCVEQGMKPYREHPLQKAGLGEMY